MLRWSFLALAACGAPVRLGGLEVSFGTPEPLPLVQPSTDTRRWYVPMDTRALGPVVWFVDTGYTYSTCDDDLVEALGIAAHGTVTVRGELGNVEAQKVLLPSLELGGHQIDDLVCVVRDLDVTSSLDDPEEVHIAGVIGMDVLRKFRMRIDPTRGQMTLSDPETAPPLAGGVGVVPLKRKGLRARMPIEIDGEVIWPILDTGASHTYVDGDALGLEPTEVADNVTVRGTGASGAALRTVRSYDLDAVRVGPWSVPALTLTDRTGRWREPGLLGLDVLSGFDQEYDFARGRARLTPTAGAELPQFAAWWPGQRLVPARLLDLQVDASDAVLVLGPAAAAAGPRPAGDAAEPAP